MTSLARAILTSFAEAYPASAHSRGGRRLRIGDWQRRYPRIGADVEAKTEFLDAVEEVIATGLITPKWRRYREGDELQALYLDDPAGLYRLLGRPSPESVRERMLDCVNGPEWTGQRETPLRNCVRERVASLLAAGHPTGVDSVEELRDLAIVLGLTPADTRGLPIRALSTRLFNDSKRLESILPSADKLTTEVGLLRLSDSLGLARSYPEVSLALSGDLLLERPEATWRCSGRPLTLPLPTVRAIAGIRLERGAAVLSVENKETFYTAVERLDASAFSCVVYTAGHRNAAVIALLERVRDSGGQLYHFGDLDPDGLQILIELRRALAVTVVPFAMDRDTYHRHAAFGYPLDSGRRERLARLLQPDSGLPAELVPTAREMLAAGVGVEQEVIATSWRFSDAGLAAPALLENPGQNGYS